MAIELIALRKLISQERSAIDNRGLVMTG